MNRSKPGAVVYKPRIRNIIFDIIEEDSMSGEPLRRASRRLVDASETVENAAISEQLAALARRCRYLSDNDPDTDQLVQLETTIRSTSRHLDGDVAVTVRRAGQDVVVYRDQR